MSGMMDQICGMWGTIPATIEVETKAPPVNDDDELVSPFIAYSSDGYMWPDLYTEFDECLEACVLIYPLAELRRLARENELENSKAILNLPVSHAEVLSYVEANQDMLTKTKFAEEFYVEILEAVAERNEVALKGVEHLSSRSLQHMHHTSIIAFDDEFEKEELVYSIEVNHARKNILVCFRGSVTKTDWATDFEIFMKEVKNPVGKHRDQEPTVRVHNGFHDYMFEPSSRGAKGPEGEPLSEYEEILQEHVLPVIRKYPGYKLYVTGHSLGAALATLFAFEAAAEPDDLIPKPVSCFSIAGPYVGDYSFRAAHQLLEAQGKLRHLRVTNHKDLVTIVPKMSFKWRFYDSEASVGSLFKHVGMNVKLYEGDAPFEVGFPTVRSGQFSGAWEELARGWDQTWFSNWSWNPVDYWKWPAHSLREYNKRAMANKPGLQSVQLNDLYSRKDIVGNLVPQF